MKQVFCPYCRTFRADDGQFKFVVHVKTGSKRRQCSSCQETRKLPRDQLEQRAKADREARRKSISDATKRGMEEKRKNENTDFE